MTDKLNNVMLVKKEDGEVLTESKNEIINFVNLEKNTYTKNLLMMAKNNPNNMNLRELTDYFKINGRNPNKILGFEKYHQVNQHYDKALFEMGLSKESMYYFNYLVAYLCNLTYTLEFENHTTISTDIQLYEFLKLSPKSWRSIRNELFKYNLIKQITFDGNKVFKINPCFIGKEKILTPSTYHAFRDDLLKFKMINNMQKIYWDKYMQSEYGIDYNLVEIGGL